MSPFNFCDPNLADIYIRANGTAIPSCRQHLDTSTGYLAYLNLFQTMGQARTTTGMSITPSEWRSHLHLYAFEVAPVGEMSTWPVTEAGSVTVHARFKTVVPDGGYYMIALFEYSNCMQIYADRTVQIDYQV